MLVETTLLIPHLAILGALIGLAGSGISSGLSYKIAKENRAWQERMSNTAYQRSMADMRKAGLNPILAYKTGGATTPSGSLSTVQDPTPSMMSSFSAKAVRDLNRENAKTVAQNRILSLPEQRYEALKNSLKLKALETGISSAKQLTIGPDNPANAISKGLKELNKMRKGMLRNYDSAKGWN